MSILFSQKYGKNNEISPLEADFTEVLSTIAVMPKMLYFYGKLPENRAIEAASRKGVRADLSAGRLLAGSRRPPTVAIVGTRKPTEYGRKVAYELGYEMARRGAVVVSGLAFGIDSVAHRAALDAGGVTVAVLGTPISRIYPEAHLGLAMEIIEAGGAILSELGPEAAYGRDYVPKTSFLMRNRLISGLSDAVIVVEAAERSGSLNTAAHALEQGKEIFAVPGDIDRPMSKGCNRLLEMGAAQAYTGVESVASLLFPEKKRQRRPKGDNTVETKILELIEAGARDGEEILAQLGLGAAEFSQVITMMEIKGEVRALGCNKWMVA